MTAIRHAVLICLCWPGRGGSLAVASHGAAMLSECHDEVRAYGTEGMLLLERRAS